MELNRSQLETLKWRVKEANVKAAKADLQPITVTVNSEYQIMVELESGLCVPSTRFNVTLSGADQKLGDYRLLAVLQKERGVEGTLVLRLDDGDVDLAAYRGWDSSCDHCHQNRSRLSGLVLADAEGAIKVIGTTCSELYTGVAFSAAKLASFSELAGFFGDDEELGSWKHKPVASPVAVIAATVLVARAFGYVSKKQQSERGGQSTADVVSELVFGKYEISEKVSKLIEKVLGVNCPQDSDVATAEQVLAYVAGLSGASDYEYNLKALCAAELVPEKRNGFVVSAYGSYKAAEARKVADANRVKPEGFVGKVGQRLNLDVTVQRVHHFEGSYGVTTIVSLIDTDGHVYTWFASGSRDFEAGEKLAGKGTVKAHKADPKFGDSTVLTRCSF